MKRVLLIGGTGVFGRRLAHHLARHGPSMDLVVTSRSAARAEALAREIGARGTALDTRADLAATLRSLHPFVVIDCSGPFQGLDHGTARAAIEAGAHAVDLADARDYLRGYGTALDGLAREHGVAALGGASSTPALSGAAARALTEGWKRVDTLDFAITPGGRSEVGPAVLQAVLSYAGRPVPVWKGEAIGWSGGHRVEMPGLGPRRIAPVETADAEWLGPLLGVRERVSFGAGLESAIEQRGLEALAWFRERGWIDDPAPVLPLLRAARRLTRITTSDRGGMALWASGSDARGRAVRASWSLVATHDDGPQVPALAAAAAVRALLTDEIDPGARLADEVLALETILAEAAPYRIATRVRCEGAEEAIPDLIHSSPDPTPCPPC